MEIVPELRVGMARSTDRKISRPTAAAETERLRVSIVIPLYNERDTILEVLRRVERQNEIHQIVIVDDGSTDGTREMLARDVEDKIDDVFVEYLPQNSGKGAALRHGLSLVSANVVIIQDADLEYDPRDYGRLLEPIRDGRADIVYGSRSKATQAAYCFSGIQSETDF